jgi:Leucine-rich repeat (LRR) protein
MVASSQQRQKANRDKDNDDSDNDNDDDGLLEDIVAQMDKMNDNGDGSKKTNRSAKEDDDDGKGVVAVDPSTILTRDAPPRRNAPGAIRIQNSGSQRNNNHNRYRNNEQAGEAYDVSEDLEQQPFDGADAAPAATTAVLATMAVDDTNDVICANIVDEGELEAEFQERMRSKIVEATEVRIEEEARTKQQQEEEKEKKAAEKAAAEERKLKKRRMLVVGGIGIALVVVIVVVIVVVMVTSGSNTELSDYEYMEELFLPFSGSNITIEGTPQYQALNWLAYEDAATWDIQSTSTTYLIQRYAMVVFFYSTGGPTTWTDDLRFLSNYSVCEWPNLMGIEEDARTDNEVDCNDKGEIVKIRVESNNLTGTIPQEIAAISTLEIFTTGDNPDIVGTIPSELGKLSLLNFLQFAGCSLTGTIPDTFRNLYRLETFSMYNNNLHGTLPVDFLKDISYNLINFDVGNNMFTGTIPDVFNTQSPLRIVYMEGNEFEGTIPSTLYSQPNLEVLTLSNNQLNGTIAAQIRAMDGLRSVYLDGNKLNGSIPVEISSLGNLEQIHLSSNRFEGFIPVEVSLLSKLTIMDFSNNSFSGSLPSEMGLLENLSILNLESNPDLSGSVPESFSQLTVLEKLFLQNTNITSGLNEVFCSKDYVITEIQADCAIDNDGNLNGSVSCDCCTTCCESGGIECDISVQALCDTKSAIFQSRTERGAVCNCTEDGTNVTCSDTTCESCNLEESSCATNQNYGYSLNQTTGQVLSFQNTIRYSSGPWNGTELFYQSLEDGPNCALWVNGVKCRECSNIICSSGFVGFRIVCNNLQEGSVFNR